jgi:hypothetical protein
MEGHAMIGRFSICIAVLLAAGQAVSAMTSVGADRIENVDAPAAAPAASSIWERPAAQLVAAPTASAPVPERALSANPLWEIPLSALSTTRERPIFSPLRRPAPSAVQPSAPPKLAVVPKPVEPERPQLALVGTVSSTDEAFGIFLDQSTKSALRLKVGEDYQGWKLRSVQGREATLAKDQAVVILALPQPGTGQPAAAAQPLLPVPSRPRRDR